MTVEQLIQLITPALAQLGVAGIFVLLFIRKDKRMDEVVDKVFKITEEVSTVVQGVKISTEANTKATETNTKVGEANLRATEKLADRVELFLRDGHRK